MWAVRKFCHYLIGTKFTLKTDHQPYKWLDSARKSRAHSQRLERWALELHAYEFDTIYQPGAQNQVADALSHCSVNLVTLNPPVSKADLSEAQKIDPVLKSVIDHLLLTDIPLTSGKWRTFPHRRFKQLWSQLCMYYSLLCHKVKTPTLAETKHLIIVPQSFQKQFLSVAHEASKHQGSDRTFSILSDSAYWAGMA